MNRNSIIQYYVEGEDEKKLLEMLKSNQMIYPGRIQVFNAICERVTKARMMTLKQGTYMVLIFDTDVEQIDILLENIKMLNECAAVSGVLTIPQSRCLEDELVRCCNVKDVKEIFGNTSVKGFKSSFIKEKNLKKRLDEAQFDFGKLWNQAPSGIFAQLSNDAQDIKH